MAASYQTSYGYSASVDKPKLKKVMIVFLEEHRT